MSTKIVIVLIAALFLIVPLGCQPEAARQAESLQMFKDYCATWSSHDVDKMVSFFADSCVYENLAQQKTYNGREGVRAYAKTAFEAIPDFKLQVTSLFVSGDWVACEWVMSGTQTVTAANLPPTKKSFTVRGSTIALLRDGKILRNADYWDLMTFLRQLGLITA